MKKIMVFVVFFFTIMLNVSAESVEYNGNIPGIGDDAFMQSSKIADKYLLINHNSALLYSDSGEIEKTISCDDAFIIDNGVICRDEIYNSEDSSSISYYTLYDSNLNKVITKPDESKTGLYSDEIIVIKYNDYYVFVSNNMFYIPLILDEDMNEASDEVYYEITEHYYGTFNKIRDEIYNSYDDFWLMSMTNNNYLFTALDESDYSVDLLLYDNQGNLIFKMDAPSVIQGFTAAIANNGIYIIYISEDNGLYYLEKYDLNGNKIYTQSLSDLVNFESFSAYRIDNIYASGDEINIIVDMGARRLPTEPSKAYSYMISFSINYDILTNATGYGLVEVDETGVYNEEKVMQITPEPGNKIASLVITDSAGNNISYTADYKFIMPNSDVTIDVTFELETAAPSGDDIDIENPNTGAVLPIFLLTGGIIASFIIYKYTKKKRIFTRL